MKRPLFWIGLALLCFVSICYTVAGIGVVAALLLTTLLLLTLCKQPVRIALPLFCCTAVLSFGLVQADLTRLSQRAELLAGKEVEAVVTVTELTFGSGRQQLEGVADIFCEDGVVRKALVSFSLPDSPFTEEMHTIRINASITSSKEQLSAQTLPLRNAIFIQEEQAAVDAFAAIASQLRALLSRRVFTVFNGDTARLLAAMLLGDTTHLTSPMRKSLAASGLSHLVAVSGLHLSVLLQLAASQLKSKNKLLKTSVLLLLCWGFAALTGLGVSVQRAALMVTLMLLADCTLRSSDSLTSLGAALSLILLFDPAAALSYATWLSCFATGGILLLALPIEERLRRKGTGFLPLLGNRFAGAVSVTLAAQLAALPLLILMGQSLSLWSVLANIPAAFFVGILLPLGYLSLLPGIAVLLAPAVRSLSLLLLRTALLFEKVSFGHVFLNERFQIVWLFGTYLLAVLLLRYKASGRLFLRAAALSAASLATLLLLHQQAYQNSVELLSNPSKTLLALLRGGRAVVCGSAENERDYPQMAAALHRLGVERIDCLLFTGNQAPDRQMQQLLEQFGCNSVYAPDSYQSVYALKASEYTVYKALQPEFAPLGIAAHMTPDSISFHFYNATLLKLGDRYDILTEEKQYPLLSERAVLRYRFYLDGKREH